MTNINDGYRYIDIYNTNYIILLKLFKFKSKINIFNIQFISIIYCLMEQYN